MFADCSFISQKKELQYIQMYVHALSVTNARGRD